jgi:hypothetical protein
MIEQQKARKPFVIKSSKKGMASAPPVKIMP